MYEYKTICASRDFDAKLNEAVAAGWELQQYAPVMGSSAPVMHTALLRRVVEDAEYPAYYSDEDDDVTITEIGRHDCSLHIRANFDMGEFDSDEEDAAAEDFANALALELSKALVRYKDNAMISTRAEVKAREVCPNCENRLSAHGCTPDKCNFRREPDLLGSFLRKTW